MKKYEIKHLPIKPLSEVIKETTAELDGVIIALGGIYPPPNPETIVTYQNGDVVEYLIEGELGQNSIPNKNNIVKVKIGDAVTSIGVGAFDFYQSQSNLSEVFIPDSVTSIGNQAFCDCSSLTSITIPNSVIYLGNWVFSGCDSIKSLVVPGHFVASDVFEDSYQSISKIEIADGTTSITANAFTNCSSLTSITIPNSVTSIGKEAFDGCSSLTSITIPNSVMSIGDYAFNGCFGLTSVTIPDSVTYIGDDAFSGCSGLTSITIPSAVTNIGDYAFSNTSIMDSTFVNKTADEVQEMEYYPWGLTPGGTIHCSDIDIVVPESGGSSS